MALFNEEAEWTKTIVRLFDLCYYALRVEIMNTCTLAEG